MNGGIRTKYLVREVDLRAGESDLPLLSVSQYRGVVRRSELTDKPPRAEELNNYKVCQSGDIVINRMSAYQGAIGRSPQSGIVSPDYLVLRPGKLIDSSFLHHLFRSSWFVGEIVQRLRGIGSVDLGNVRTPRINPEDLGAIRIPVPPLEEQRRIASFLDAEVARIDRLQAARLKQAELLDAWIRSMLDGIFNEVRSGTPTRLKYLLSVRPRYGVLVPQFAEEGVPFIRVNDLLDLKARSASLRKIPSELSVQYARTIVEPGDLLVSVVGTLGRTAIAPPSLKGANIARAVCSVRVAPDVEAELVKAWIGTTSFLSQAVAATSTDTAQPTLGMEDFGNFRLTWPTDKVERQRMLSMVLSAQELLTTLKVSFDRQRKALAERRQALITFAVTGQIDMSTASGRGIED